MPTLVELSDTRALSITFTKDQHAALVRLSEERRRAIAYLVREAVDAHFKLKPPASVESEQAARVTA